MAVKHVKEYYNQICEQYAEMLDNIKCLEEEAAKGLVEPERIERLSLQIAPIKQNYERWAYMMYLLNQPAKKSKKKKYQENNKKLLSSIAENNTVDSVIAENKEAMTHIGE